MAKLTMTTFVTLDGVMQAPGGPAEDTSGEFAHGGWSFHYADPVFGEFMLDVFSRAGAFLLGRRTYEIFAAHWPRVTDPADPIAGALNRLPKHVASRTLARAEWAGSSVLRDVVPGVARLKEAPGAELQVHGSGELAQTLLGNDLVDELNLLIFPLVLGSGRRLFGAGTVPAAFELASTRTTGTGVVISVYRRVGRPRYGSFALE